MVFGKKGSGKTTFLAKTAYRYLKKGWRVYSTEKVPGVIQFDVNEVGYVTFPEKSVLLIDEVGMIWDNRNFKNFKEEVRDYFKFQRHERHVVYLFSQTFDVDLKLRNLTDGMYLCVCKFGWLSIARKIKRSIVLVQPHGDSESRIADNLEFEPIIWSLFGAKTCIFTYIPHWIHLFDSHEKLGLPLHEDDSPVPIPEAAAKMFRFLNKDEDDCKLFFDELIDLFKFLIRKDSFIRVHYDGNLDHLPFLKSLLSNKFDDDDAAAAYLDVNKQYDDNVQSDDDFEYIDL